jgi:hypothetical protein
MPHGPWTAREIETLRKLTQSSMRYDEISERLGRSPAACAHKAREIGLPYRWATDGPGGYRGGPVGRPTKTQG